MRNGKIFLVEDNPNDVALTRRALNKSGMANPLVVAEDGQEALDYLFGTGAFQGRDPLDVPALILLDLKLPKINGLEILKRIRADPRTRRIPVVIMTSSNQEEDRATGYDIGVNSYIQKPVSFERFVTAISQLGIYWLLLNEEPPKVKPE
jgi:two-component system, response regulator